MICWLCWGACAVPSYFCVKFAHFVAICQDSQGKASKQAINWLIDFLTLFDGHGIIWSYSIHPLMTDGTVEHHTE